MEYSPLAFVLVPIFVPLIKTVTPLIALLVSASVMVPDNETENCFLMFPRSGKEKAEKFTTVPPLLPNNPLLLSITASSDPGYNAKTFALIFLYRRLVPVVITFKRSSTD